MKINNLLKKILKSVNKCIKNIEHPIIRIVIILIFVIYISNIIKPINLAVSRVLRGDIIRLLVVIVIVIVGMNDPLLSLLLGLSLVISLQNQENLETEDDNKENKLENSSDEKAKNSPGDNNENSPDEKAKNSSDDNNENSPDEKVDNSPGENVDKITGTQTGTQADSYAIFKK